MPQIATAYPPVTSITEAHDLVSHFSEVMDTLLGFIEEETRLVREGKLSEVARLEARKADLARLDVADSERLKVSKPFLVDTMPDLLKALRDRQRPRTAAPAPARHRPRGVRRHHARRVGGGFQKFGAAGLWRLRPRRDAQPAPRPAADREPRAVDRSGRKSGWTAAIIVEIAAMRRRQLRILKTPSGRA
jgi:hypothetical protein